MEDVNKLTTDDPIKLVIANKSDLNNNQVFDTDIKVNNKLYNNQNFTTQTGIEVIKASAKNSIGITETFEKLTTLLIEKK